MILPAASLQSAVLCPTNFATALYKYADGFLVLNSLEQLPYHTQSLKHVHGRPFLYSLVLYHTTAH